MKSPMPWTIAAALGALSALSPGHAQEPLGQRTQAMQGFQISVPPSPPLPPTTLVPGTYVSAGEGAMAGGQEPRAFVVRIDRVDGNRFNGELEVIRPDEKGALVRLDSKFTGTIGVDGLAIVPDSPLTIALQDEPLRSLMTDVTGAIGATGSADAAGNLRIDKFSLRWQLTGTAPGYDKLGANAAFVLSDQDGYAQTIALYKTMADDKKQLMELQAASAEYAENQLKAYLQETDQFLKGPPQGDQDEVVAKAAALYKREKALLAGHPPSDEDAAPKEARLAVMQIDAYWSQLAYLNERQSELARYWLGRGAAVSDLVSYSPCVSVTSPGSLSYGASPACAALAAAYDAVQKRMREVSMAQGNTRPSESSMECLWHAAHQALRPKGLTIPDYCAQSLAPLESGAAK